MKSTYYYTPYTKLSDILRDNFRRQHLLDMFRINCDYEKDLSVKDLCAGNDIHADLFVYVCNVYSFDDYSIEDNLLGEFPLTQAIDYIIKAHYYFNTINKPHILQIYDTVMAFLPKRDIVHISKFFDTFWNCMAEHISTINQIFEQYLNTSQTIKSVQFEYLATQKSEINRSLDAVIRYLSDLQVEDLHGVSFDQLRIYLIFMRSDFDRHNVIKDAVFRRLVRN